MTKIKRKTIQRKFITEVFDAGKEHHISAERMFEIVSRKHPMIGRATIYRNLAAMAEDGLLKRLEIPGGPDCFDTVLGDHYHLRCTVCRNIFDVEMAHVSHEEIHAKISDTRGFDISGYVLAFQGTCPKCKERRKKSARPPAVENIPATEATTASAGISS